MPSIIKLNIKQVVASESSVTTAQKHAAVYLFGSKGESIIKRLDEMNRAKELVSPHIGGLLKFLKEAPDDDIIAFKTSAVGKKTIEGAKAFASAKTLVTSINALRQIKVSGEWLDKPQGSTAPAETKTHRASKKGTGKGAAPIVVENPQAPAAVVSKDDKITKASDVVYSVKALTATQLKSIASDLSKSLGMVFSVTHGTSSVEHPYTFIADNPDSQSAVKQFSLSPPINLMPADIRSMRHKEWLLSAYRHDGTIAVRDIPVPLAASDVKAQIRAFNKERVAGKTSLTANASGAKLVKQVTALTAAKVNKLGTLDQVAIGDALTEVIAKKLGKTFNVIRSGTGVLVRAAADMNSPRTLLSITNGKWTTVLRTPGTTDDVVASATPKLDVAAFIKATKEYLLASAPAGKKTQAKTSPMLNKVWDLSKFESNLLDPSWNTLVSAFNTEFKGRYVLKLNKREGAFRINTLKGGYSGRGEAFLSLSKESNTWVLFANDPATRGAAYDSWHVGPKLTFATIVSYLSNELAGPSSGEKQEIDKLIEGAVIYPHQDRYF